MTNAMRRFAVWVSARRYRLILLAIACINYLPPISAALIVLDMLRRGPSAGAISILSIGAGTLLIAVLVNEPVVQSISLTFPVLLAAGVSAGLLGWSRNLSLAFQLTVIGSIVLTLFVFVLIPEAAQIGAYLKNEVGTLLETGGASAEQLLAWQSLEPSAFTSVLLISSLGFIVTGLFLGFWWYTLTIEGVSFGAEFRELKLGLVTGIVLMVLVTANQLFDAELIGYLAALAVLGFLFQGLAVLHARSHQDKWPFGVILMVYLLLVSPLYLYVFMGICAIGLLDNFFSLRRQPPRDN